jgi:acyl-CoA hydrolase
MIRFVSVGGFGTHSRLAEAGCLDVIPCRFSDLPDLIASDRVGIDVAMFSGSVPDADGLVSLGPTIAISHEMMAAARVSLLEVNPNVPYVLGDTLVDVGHFDAVIVSEGPLVTAPRAKTRVSAAAKALCENVASLVPDRSTLQVGLGSVGQALPRFLAARKDIGIHSSIMTDQLAELVESGVVNGAAKERDRGIAVTGELLGTEQLYRFAARNPKVMLRRTSYLLSEEVLTGFRALVSVNGALQVDLTGQVNAESRGGVHVGAVGGAVDFIRAAARSTAGASIIALQSTTSNHQSRIVDSLDNGVVSTPRSEVEFVVTEYGVADLRGRPIAERAEALAAIAHPDHRRMLSAAVALS